jgi:beta-glucosidase
MGRTNRTAAAAVLIACVVFTFYRCDTPQSEMAKTMLPYQNPDLSLDQRIDDLVSRMTLEEKVGQTLYEAPAIDRLGIPAYNWWNEALHGVARAGRATVFPQAIGLAATWDTDLMLEVATVISDEARAKHHESVRRGRRGIYEGLTFWSPNINIFRDPRWGRGMETYGEDPYLTGRLGVEFVKGLQGDDPRYLKTVATPKHYAVHSGPEPDRHSFDAVVDERDLRETYLPAFRATILEADAQSVMCAYNRFRGKPCCGSDELLQKILREEWGFSGYVVSDCWAIKDIYEGHKTVGTGPEAAAVALRSGTDLNCGDTYGCLVKAVDQGLISEAEIDLSLKRLLRARFMLGMFDPPERVPYAGIPHEINEAESHRELALRAARKSIVLLKNDRNILPLRKDLNRVAVIGPNANDVEVLLGNYNGVPSDPVTPLEGIRQKLPEAEVVYERGCDIAERTPTPQTIPSSVLLSGPGSADGEGLRAEYFNNNEFEAEPFVVRTDATVDFEWWEDPPLARMKPDGFSVRWTGVLVPETSGRYSLGVRAFGGARFFLDGSLLVEFSDRHHAHARLKEIRLEAGRHYEIRLEYWDRRADAMVQLVWARPDAGLHEKAVEAARGADLAIMVMGLSPRIEGEEMPVSIPGFSGGDRTEIGLPGPQEKLIRDVAALGKPLVLVLLNGSALAVNWAAQNVPAIVEAWYPGQAAGRALADVLFGDHNPAGRLPVTFYRSVEQLPPFKEYAMKERTYRYFTGEPLFPFGHGLSYTTFEYSDLQIPGQVQSGDEVAVEVRLKNSGEMAGEEVVQLYLTDLEASGTVPIRSLKGFRRVHLEPGEEKVVTFTLHPRQLSLIDNEQQRVLEPGSFQVSVGGKQPGFSGVADTRTSGLVTGRFEIVGAKMRF